MQYVHGGDIYNYKEYDKILDFSTNINPFGASENVIAAAQSALKEIHHYPDSKCRALVRKIADYLELPESYILCGNGAADLIFSYVLAEKPKKALVTAPTFSEYEQALRTVGCDIHNVYLYTKDDFEVNENILLNLTSDLDVVFLCSPNNPTGKKIPKNLLTQILEKCVEYQIRLILDECFYEFLENPEEATMQAEVKNCSQLVILRAFTKMHAIPGLRLGYILCRDNSLLERIQRVRQPWSVSTVAQAAGLAAIEDEERVEKTRQYITKERKRMELELESIGISYIQSDANYILIYYEGKESLYEKLLEKNILIRDCQNYIGLKKGYYRIAIKRKEENDRLLTALREEVEKWQNLL